jgi:hypothetical protein
MVQGIPKGVNPDDSFSHRYAGGINQYGTKGAENQDQFQGYMNDGMTGQASQNQAPTPMSLMSSKAQPTFGPPPSTQASGLQGAAPENFGPPRINATDTSNTSQFGAPGFQGKNSGPPQLGATNQDNSSKLGAPPPSGDNKPNLGATKGGGGEEDSGKGKKDKKVYKQKEVVKMMTEQMVQGAIARMKIKDPDPGVWKQ